VRAFLDIIEGRPDAAVVQVSSHFDKPTQELLLVMLPLIARLSEGGINKAKPEDLSPLLNQIESAWEVVGPRAALSIEKMCYAQHLDQARFGVYQQLSEDHAFRPGELVELYVELRNFSSERRDRFYEIHLERYLEIRDSSGQVRWQLPIPDRVVTDKSLSPRHDHFISYRFFLPSILRKGQYTLHVRVTDTPTQRTAERSLNLQVTNRPVPGQ